MAAIAFEEFWKAYPLRKDRAAAGRAWSRMSAKDRRAAMGGIASYAGECLATGVAMAYPANYLRDRRWEDEPAPDTTAQPAAPAGAAQERMDEW